MKKTARLRDLLKKPGIIVAPGAHNAFTARIIEQTGGFQAVYMTGSGAAMSLIGEPDVGLLTMTEMVTQARNMANAVDLPVIADADTGYGNAINVVRTVKEYERAGVAGIHIEEPLLVNMDEGTKTPLLTVHELEEMGYKIVIFPRSAPSAAARAIQELMQLLKETGTTQGFSDRIVTFEGRNLITGLAKYREMEKNYLAQE